MLEYYNIPYVGTDAYGLLLSLNKFHTKLIAEHYKISTPKYDLIETSENVSKKVNSLTYPLVIKPNSEGSSIGVI